MKKKITALTSFLLVTLLFVGLSPVIASDISSAQFYGVITVSNNSTANTSVPTTFTANTTAWIANSIMNSSANNTAIRTSSGADVAYTLGYAGNPGCLFVPSIGTNTQLTNILYTGGTDNMNGKIRYFPAAGGMTIVDNDDPVTGMEPSDNFSMTLKAWFDTVASLPYLEKSGAVSVNNTATNEITATVYSGAFPTVMETVSGNNTVAGLNHTVTLPTIKDKDDLLLIIFGSDGNPTVTYPAGWTKLFQSSSGVAATLSAGYKMSSGAEPASIVVTTSASEMTAWNIYSIRGAATLNIGAAATGASANPDPPALTPSWGALNTLWIAAVGIDGNSVVNPWAYPANYTNGFYDTAANAGGVCVGSARRELNAASNDPGTFTTSNDDWVTNTIAVWPATKIPVTASSGEKTVTVTMDSPFLSLNPDGAATPPVTTGLVLNAPLPQPEEYAASGGTFTTIDATAPVVTVSGAVWDADNGYTFDAIDDYFSVAHNANQLLTTGGSIEAWFNAASLGENNLGKIVDKSTGNYGQDGYSMLLSAGPVVYFTINDGAGISTGAGAVAFGSMVNVTATFDGTGDGTLYVNGVQSGTTGVIADPATITTANAMRIGNRSGGTDRTFDGKIAEVRLYNVELTPAQVLQNYNATKSKYTTGNIHTYSTLASVLDNASDWVIKSNAFIESFDFYKGGNHNASIAWEYGATFTDSTGNGNDATPTYRTTDASPYISAALTSFSPVSEAQAPAYTLTDAPAFFTTIPGISGNFSIGMDPTYPGHEVITQIAAAGAVPQQLPIVIFSTMVLIIISLALSAMMKSGGVNSLFIKMCIIVAVMCIYVALSIMDPWQVYFFTLIGISLCWLSRQREAY